jgi:hypothetical protein
MSINKYKPHIYVLPEDDANRQIANGFLLNLNLRLTAIRVLREAGGWMEVINKFKSDYLHNLQQNLETRIILLLDFDGKPEDRLSLIGKEIPEDIKSRVFVLGVSSEPEKLKQATSESYEAIGIRLAKDYAESRQDFWNHNLLKHNESELTRLIKNVKPFLFD